MSADLCPFCGSSDAYVECLGGVFCCTYAMICNSCGARGPSVERGDYGDGEDRETVDATTAWNRRTTLTEEQLRDRLFEVGKPSLREWCRVHGVNSAHANEFATGIRGPGSDLLKALAVGRAYAACPSDHGAAAPRDGGMGG